MNLGVFLAIGESLADLKEKGQLARLLDYNIRKYSQNFDKVYIFSYKKETVKLPKNCELVPNHHNIHRYVYSLILPFLNLKQITNCNALRGLQLTGAIPAVVCKFFFGKKFVVNYGYDYGRFLEIEGKYILNFIFKVIKNPILFLADRIIVTSKEIKKSLVFYSDKIEYIPNGVDSDLFKPNEVKKKKSRLRIIFLGRLEVQKNLFNLISAISKLSKKPQIYFYGSGSLKKKLLIHAFKSGVSLTIRNPVPYKQVPKVLTGADIFVLPSIEEGNPKILLEAMSCGLSVIGSNVPGIRELIADGKNGVLSGTSAEEIAQAINRLSKKVYRQKLGIEARKFVIKNYNLESLLEKEVKLLKNL